MSDDGGPAFLCDENRTGLSKREWFAGQALVVVLQVHGYVIGGSKKAAQIAYDIADAMIEEGKPK